MTASERIRAAREAHEWAQRADSDTLAAMLSTGLPADHPSMVAANAEWDRRFPRTSVYRPDPLRMDRVVVAVRGRRGRFDGVRMTWASAVGTARKYAALLDAPCEVI